MKLINQVCHNCTKRHPHCHSRCEDYIRAKEETEKVKQKKREDDLYSGYISDLARRRELERKRNHGR